MAKQTIKRHMPIIISLIFVGLMFGVPIVLAYQTSAFLENTIINRALDPLTLWANQWPEWLEVTLAGDYGLLTLGTYSVVWALPVVLYISTATSIVEVSGIKGYLIDRLDPLLNKVGLHGNDLIPIISGFGCNVVALHQSNRCGGESGIQCASFIAFGSACSYQIGATLSIFNAANIPWMFISYLLLLTIVGVLHNKIWYPVEDTKWARYFQPNHFVLAMPKVSEIIKRVWTVLIQFIKQAMPIFLLICIVASFLKYFGALDLLIGMVSPLMILIGAPVEAGTTVAFSIIRKDGILLLNEGNGELLSKLSNTTIFIVVYLASTLSGCLVTIMTIAVKFKKRLALQLVIKQLITSIISAVVVVWFLRIFTHFL